MTCATIWDNVESELKLFSGEKNNQIIITIKTSAQKHVILSLSHTHTQMLFILKKRGKKVSQLSFPESFVGFPNMLAGCMEKREEPKCQGSPDKDV